MKKEIVANAKGELPIVDGIETETMVFVSGQGGLDPVTGAIVGDDIRSQTIQTFENMRTILRAAALELDDLVKVTIYLSDTQYYQSFNELFSEYFQAPYPSRTAVYCRLNYGLLVEVDGIAVKRSVEQG